MGWELPSKDDRQGSKEKTKLHLPSKKYQEILVVTGREGEHPNQI